MSREKILVLGGTGRVGGGVSAGLLGGGYRVRVVTRHALPAMTNGIDYVRGDIRDKAVQVAAFAGVDRVFLASGDALDQEAIETAAVEGAKAAGVGHVVKLSAHAAGWTPPLSVGIAHRAIEQRLQASGIAWTILRPVFFQQTLLMFADEIRASGRFTVPMRRGRVSFVDIRDVAAVAVECLGKPQHFGQIYELTGPEALTLADVAAEISRVTARIVRHRPIPPYVARIMLPLAAGIPRWQTKLLVDLFQKLELDWEAGITTDVERVSGRPPRRLSAFIDECSNAFASASGKN